jgi:hypothetical protein
LFGLKCEPNVYYLCFDQGSLTDCLIVCSFSDYDSKRELKLTGMKKPLFLLLVAVLVAAVSCNKDDTSDKFSLLTAHVWTSDSLLADGIDASGSGELLEKFKGDIVFNEDGTGTFGQYSGTWMFVDSETNLVITSPDLPFSLTTHIVELTKTSLKVTFVYPVQPPINIRMTFKPK